MSLTCAMLASALMGTVFGYICGRFGRSPKETSE